jgi:hypothetical protein
MTLERDFDLTQMRWTVQATDLFRRAVERTPALLEPLLERRGATSILDIAPGARREGDKLLPPANARSVIAVRPVPRPQPFAFAASRVEIIEDANGWLVSVARLGPASRETALVARAQLASFAPDPPPATVTIVERTPGHVTLDVSASGPTDSFVAINQTWHAGWRARIDGQPGRLLRTDVGLSGLPVPPGLHRITLAYEAPWLKAGMAVSGLATIPIVLIFGWRHTRRPVQVRTRQ